MAADHRLTDTAGNPLDYSCGNRRYRTNTAKGFPHGTCSTRGSVLKDPLVSHGYSLWLEHVEEIDTGDEVYWLMWYDQHGKPTIPMSGILDRDELAEMSKQLAGFVP